MNNYDLSNVKVLVVERSEAMRSLFKSLLKVLNLRDFNIVDGGKEALESFNLNNPDLLLVDWVTSDISGLDLVHAIRNREISSNQYVSIIMMSGLSSYDNIIKARDAGVHEFLAKPLSPNTLYEKICRVIEHPRNFVRCDDYFGPDRRRATKPLKYGQVERRKETKDDSEDDQNE